MGCTVVNCGTLRCCEVQCSGVLGGAAGCECTLAACVPSQPSVPGVPGGGLQRKCAAAAAAAGHNLFAKPVPTPLRPHTTLLYHTALPHCFTYLTTVLYHTALPLYHTTLPHFTTTTLAHTTFPHFFPPLMFMAFQQLQLL